MIATRSSIKSRVGLCDKLLCLLGESFPNIWGHAVNWRLLVTAPFRAPSWYEPFPVEPFPHILLLDATTNPSPEPVIHPAEALPSDPSFMTHFWDARVVPDF